MVKLSLEHVAEVWCRKLETEQLRLGKRLLEASMQEW